MKYQVVLSALSLLLVSGCRTGKFQKREPIAQIVYDQREPLPFGPTLISAGILFIQKTGYSDPLYIRCQRLETFGVKVEFFKAFASEFGHPGDGNSSDERKLGTITRDSGVYKILLDHRLKVAEQTLDSQSLISGLAITRLRNSSKEIRVAITDRKEAVREINLEEVPIRPGGGVDITIKNEEVTIEAGH